MEFRRERASVRCRLHNLALSLVEATIGELVFDGVAPDFSQNASVGPHPRHKGPTLARVETLKKAVLDLQNRSIQ
jgi:hypothetical protein